MTHDPLATAVVNAVRELREAISVTCPETGATVIDADRIDRIVDDLEHTVVSYRDETDALRRERDEARALLAHESECLTRAEMLRDGAREQCDRAQARMRQAEEALRTVAAAARELRRIEIVHDNGIGGPGADLDALWRAQNALDAALRSV